jgi:hypothetical protein
MAMLLLSLAFIKPALIGVAILLTIGGCFIPWGRRKTDGRRGRKGLLTYLIIAGLAWGVFVGQLLFLSQTADTSIDSTHWSKTLGDLVLIRPLMLLIVPLVFIGVVAGVTSIGDPSKLGVFGGSTLHARLLHRDHAPCGDARRATGPGGAAGRPR